ncbi:hypothetical protein AYO49_03685 [Verrucomicrobiaceae bacterium SCGC AG-212-N21]|nr:hypothetical protein AYO49_03685 [Verrucomicrobiaceae bacterium SCGC AG-212-N21]
MPSPPTNLAEFIATLSASEVELSGLWTDLKDKLNQEFTTFTSGLKDFSPTNPSAALAELTAEIKAITDEIADLAADLAGLAKNSKKMERLWEAVQSLTGIVQTNLPVAGSLSALGEACASAREQQKSFFHDMPDQFRKSAAKLISRYSFLQNSGSGPLLQAANALNDWAGSLAGAASLPDLIEGYPAPPPSSTQKPGLNTVRKLVASLLTPQPPQLPPSPQDAATLRRLAGDLRGLHAQVASSPSGQQNPAEQSAGLTGGGLDSLFRSLLPSGRRPGDPLRLGRDLAKLASASDGNTSDLIALMASRLHGAGGEDLFDAWRKIHTGAPIAEVYVFRRQGAVFGHNSPIGFNGTGVAAGFNNRFNSSRGDMDWDPLPDERGRILFADGEHAEVVPGSFVAIETLPVQLDSSLTFQRRRSSVLASVFSFVGATSPGLVSVPPDLDLTPYLVEDVSIGPRTAYSLSGKATRLTLPAGVSWLGGVPTGNTERFSKIRRAVIHMHSERLALAERPIERALGMGGPTADGNDGHFSDNPLNEDAGLLMLSGLHRGLAPGRWIIVQGTRAGGLTETVSEELALIAGVEHVLLPSVADSTVPKPGDAPHTLITLSKALSNAYQRSSVTIFGNVVEATHGETRKEVLGGGDARRTGQTFVLRQPPLTYVPADTESGVRNSLQLRVNGVLWHEQPDFLLSGPADRDYVVTADDGGVTRVMTGDGLHGSRLPTGLENIAAVYRSGIGKAGNVKAGALTTLLDKPLGLKEAVNPLRAGGGADRDDLAAIRRNAPASVMALDRLVSVRDYADFAVAFAGIGKAASAALTEGTETLVHVTVAAIEDAPLDPEGLLVQSLSKSLREFGDPLLGAAVAVRELVLVVLVAQIKVQDDYLWENVEPEVRAALLREFGFERRELGQDIPLSEVLAVIQGIAGVSYADVDAFGGVPEKKTVVGTGAGTSFERRALTPQEIADAIQGIVSGPPPAGQSIPAQRVVVEMARRDTADPSQVLPAQIAFLTPDAPDTLILQEIPA